MKYSQGEICARSELAARLRSILSDLNSGNLSIEGQNVEIPRDTDLDLKVKYNVDPDGGSLNIKVAWDLISESNSEESSGAY